MSPFALKRGSSRPESDSAPEEFTVLEKYPMSRTLAFRSVRPTLEALETRDLPSAGSLGFLFNQSLGQLATQMSNALSNLRSDSTNLLRDLSGATARSRAPVD